MTLSELYERLARGELKNLALVEAGAITEAEKPTVVLHANTALKKLYTRFLLREDDLYLEQKGFLTNYELSSKHAVSNYDPGAGHSFYINDMGRPFNDDLIRVLSVWNRFGEEVPLNKAHLQNSVFTPMPTVLQIPHPQDGAPVTVHYQASHPKLEVENPDAQIDLPEFLEEALTSFVAHKVLSFMNTQESSAKAQEHYNSFETICVEAVEHDLITTGPTTSSIRFERNGWV